MALPVVILRASGIPAPVEAIASATAAAAQIGLQRHHALQPGLASPSHRLRTPIRPVR
jgi:uncharacterized protein with von Willebrand factor type A (vWA) domain